MTRALAPTWLEGLGKSPEQAAPGQLEAALAGFLESARSGHPGLAMEQDDFLRAAARVSGTADPERIAKLHAADLLLATAALAGDPAALQILERKYLTLADGALAGLDRSTSFADEVRQALREKLLLGREGRPPALASYAGSGPLSAWVRISARRLALNLIEARSAKRSDEDELLALPAPGSDPELLLLRERSAKEIKRALHEGLQALPRRERLMLRMHYVEGVSMTQIGKMFGCHQSNVSRALDSARERLLAQTRQLLGDRLGLGPRELDSLVGLVQSGLDLSLSRALRSVE